MNSLSVTDERICSSLTITAFLQYQLLKLGAEDVLCRLLLSITTLVDVLYCLNVPNPCLFVVGACSRFIMLLMTGCVLRIY